MASWRSLRILLAVFGVIAGALLIPQAKDGVRAGLSPFILAARRIGETVSSNLYLVFHIATLSQENGQLRASLNQKEALAITNAELKHENELLRKELSIASESHGNLIAAHVITRTSSVSQQSIVVNKGQEDGLTKGMAVIAQGYLVGVVEESLPKTGRITLITSAQTLLPVVLQSSRSLALLKGGISGIVADEIPRDVTVLADEAVVTSNTGNIIKSGIPVGRITVVSSGKSDVFQTARVASPIDFSRLEIVFGVKE